MALGEIAAELVSSAIKPIAGFLGGFVVEILIKGLGYLVCRPFFKTVDPEGTLVGFVGVLAWLTIFFAIYSAYSYVLAIT